MKNPIILHATCVEQGQTVPEMCRVAKRLGYDGIEFRRRHSNYADTPEEYLDAIAAATEKNGLKVVMFGGPGPNLMNADESFRSQQLDDCEHFFREAAKRFKLDVCNTFTGPLLAPDTPYGEYDKNGSAVASEEQWQWAVEGFRRLGDMAQELGFRFAFETHNCYIHDLPGVCRKLISDIDHRSVGINFDYSNILLHPNGSSLAESMEILGDITYMLHLKNLYMISARKYSNFIICPLAAGVINTRELLRFFKGKNFSGPIVIETPREGDREYFAKQDMSYLKDLLAELND